MSTNIPPEAEKSADSASKNSGDTKPQNLTRQGGVVAGMTLLSRISGLLRDIVLSYLFGASAVADMFFVAFRIPNFFRRLFAEGAFSQAFVPVLMQYKAKGHNELTYFLAGLSGLFGIVLIGFVALGVVFASGLTALFAPGFIDQPEQFSATTELVRITFPYLGFISLTAFAGSLLNAHNQFALPAFTPVMLNLCLMIAAMLALTGWFNVQPVVVVAWGVMAAGIVQLGIQLPTLSRMGLLVRPQISAKHPGVRRVGVLLIPAVLAASVGQINALVNTVLASTLTSGSICLVILCGSAVGIAGWACGSCLRYRDVAAFVGNGGAGRRRIIQGNVKLGVGLRPDAGVARCCCPLPLCSAAAGSVVYEFLWGCNDSPRYSHVVLRSRNVCHCATRFCGGQSFVPRFLCAPRHAYTLSLCDCRCRGQFGRQLGNFSDDGAYRAGYGDGFVRLDPRRAALPRVASKRPVPS